LAPPPILRVIPRLDIKGPNLVKGVQLEGLRVLGKPERFAQHYYQAGADELLFMDVVASLYGRNSILELVSRTAGEVFIPLIVGGGLRNLQDMQDVLRAGADKVALNTAAVRSPELVRQAARRYGSSTIVVSIEAIRQANGRYEAFTDNGRERTGLDAFEWALRAEELGAGELLVTSVQREGTGAGYDLELTASIASSVSIPVIASGGAGTLADIVTASKVGKAQAVCIASMLHYWLVKNQPLNDSFEATINTVHLDQRRGFRRIEEISIRDLKVGLISSGVEVRSDDCQEISV
jgi:cyclase